VTDAPLTGGSHAFTGGVEGVTPGTASFTFTGANPLAPATDFAATINWGDGQTSTGAVSGPGPFTVTGSRRYAEEGSYTVTIAVADDGGSTTPATGPTAVADAQLAASCATPTVSTTSFSGAVATFTDANPGAPLTDFAATIDWGDGSTSTGTVTGPTGGLFTVTGTHTYATLGTHTIALTIKDDGGSTATAGSCTLLVYAPVPFVIGDGKQRQRHPGHLLGRQVV
jgi:hypothetical protein